jgi:hypothetical protein
MPGTLSAPEIVEYVTAGRIAAVAKTFTQSGDELLAIFRHQDAVEGREKSET